jgi:hypothetical protein
MKKWVLNVDANATDFEAYERGGLTPYGDGYSYQGSGYSDGVSGLTDGNGVGAGAGCEIGEADGYGDSHSFATSDLAWALMERR